MSKNLKKKSTRIFLYGKHTVLAALNNPKRHKYRLLISEKYKDIYTNYSSIVNIQVISKNEFVKILGINAVHQEIALECQPLKDFYFVEAINNSNPKSMIIILDQVTDPYNIGAVLRSAAAFNADLVISSYYNSPEETSIMAKSASGALDIIPFTREINLSNVIKKLKEMDYWCYALDGQGKNLPTQLPEKICFIIGSEDKGIRPLIKKNSDMVVSIPMTNKIQSLNLSNAAAIIMNQFYNS